MLQDYKMLCRPIRLGKRHLYVLDLKKKQVHEDEAVFELAGPGVTFSGQPREGKLQLTTAYSGMCLDCSFGKAEERPCS